MGGRPGKAAGAAPARVVQNRKSRAVPRGLATGRLADAHRGYGRGVEATYRDVQEVIEAYFEAIGGLGRRIVIYITDTHPLLWYAGSQHRKLSKRVSRIFDKAWNGQAVIYVPALVLWEIAMLIKIGRVRLSTRFDWWAASLAARQGFDEAGLDIAVISEALAININGDPFDEGIVATARVRGLPLITRDEAITESRLVDVVW